MDPLGFLHPNATGLAIAIAAVIGGAPLFTTGLRAFRLRRLLRDVPDLAEAPGAPLVHARGRVRLESPLFAPLSNRRCAGYRLEVIALGAGMRRALDERRAFRLVDHEVEARIEPAGLWQMDMTAERTFARGERLSEGLHALLDERAPEWLWWQRSGGALRIVERALVAGSDCHVIGSAREVHAIAAVDELEVLRTGTDDAFAFAAQVPHGPEVTIGPSAALDFLLVSDRAPGDARAAIPFHRSLGLAAGPALTLTGLLYLAHATDALRALGRL